VLVTDPPFPAPDCGHYPQWVGSAARALRLFGVSVRGLDWDAPTPDLLGVVWDPVEQHDQRDQYPLTTAIVTRAVRTPATPVDMLTSLCHR